MFNWNDFINDFPYTNFSDINVSWFLNKFKQIFDEWEGLYTTLQNWKTATDEYNENWRDEQEQAFTTWENNFQSTIDEWKTQTETDINSWESDTLANLETWKTAFIAQYNALKAEVEQIAEDAETAKNSAQASAQSAQNSANSASATAESLSTSLTQIDENTNDISDLKTQINSIAEFPEKDLIEEDEQEINGPGTKTTTVSNLSPGDVIEITVIRSLNTDTSWDVLTTLNGSTKRQIPGSASGNNTITVTVADNENGLSVRSININAIGTIINYEITVYKVISTETKIKEDVLPLIPEVDDTLTQSGEAADAKVTGDKFDEVDSKINSIATFEQKNLIVEEEKQISGPGTKTAVVSDLSPGDVIEITVLRSITTSTKWDVLTSLNGSTKRQIQGSDAGTDTVTITISSNENGITVRAINANSVGTICDYTITVYKVISDVTELKKSIIPYVGSIINRDTKIVWFGTSIPEGNLGTLSYPLVLGNKLGVTVYNEAVGSSRARASWAEFITEQNPLGAGSGYNSLIKAMGYSLAEKQYLIDNYADMKDQFTDTHPETLDAATQLAIKNYSYERKLYRYLNSKENTYNSVNTDGFVGDVDIYVFDHGYNDIANTQYNSDSTFPTAGSPNEMYYFPGALSKYISEIMKNNIHAKIVLISHYSNNETTRDGRVVENQNRIAEHWNLPIINIYKEIGWTNIELTINGTTKTVRNWWLPDGTHPASDTSGKAVERYVKLLFPYFRDYLQQY